VHGSEVARFTIEGARQHCSRIHHDEVLAHRAVSPAGDGHWLAGVRLRAGSAARIGLFWIDEFGVDKFRRLRIVRVWIVRVRVVRWLELSAADSVGAAVPASAGGFSENRVRSLAERLAERGARGRIRCWKRGGEHGRSAQPQP
jgi:hypothetical protein